MSIDYEIINLAFSIVTFDYWFFFTALCLSKDVFVWGSGPLCLAEFIPPDIWLDGWIWGMNSSSFMFGWPYDWVKLPVGIEYT
jgi:hypothetical protein